jgi:transcriptional regulator with XRE-family HTH domain
MGYTELFGIFMVDFALSIPSEISAELGRRARAKRVAANLPAAELAARIGVSDKTLLNFERTGKCSLDTFVRLLESLHALQDLNSVLAQPQSSIADLRQEAKSEGRKRAYRINASDKGAAR